MADPRWLPTIAIHQPIHVNREYFTVAYYELCIEIWTFKSADRLWRIYITVRRDCERILLYMNKLISKSIMGYFLDCWLGNVVEKSEWRIQNDGYWYCCFWIDLFSSSKVVSSDYDIWKIIMADPRDEFITNGHKKIEIGRRWEANFA